LKILMVSGQVNPDFDRYQIIFVYRHIKQSSFSPPPWHDVASA